MTSRGHHRFLLKALGFGLVVVALIQVLRPAGAEAEPPPAGAVSANVRAATPASATRSPETRLSARSAAPVIAATLPAVPSRDGSPTLDTACHVATDCALTADDCPIAVRRDALAAARRVAATTAGDAACENASLAWHDKPAEATLKASCRGGACITVRSEMFRRERTGSAELQAARGEAAKAGANARRGAKARAKPPTPTASAPTPP